MKVYGESCHFCFSWLNGKFCHSLGGGVFFCFSATLYCPCPGFNGLLALRTKEGSNKGIKSKKGAIKCCDETKMIIVANIQVHETCYNGKKKVHSIPRQTSVITFHLKRVKNYHWLKRGNNQDRGLWILNFVRTLVWNNIWFKPN